MIPSSPHDAASRPNAVLAVVASGTLLNTLAASTVNLALPAIGAALEQGIQETRWVMIGFFLSVTVALPVAGRVADLWGHRTLYQVGFMLFGLMSLACGLAPTLPLLVGGRVLQALGGAMIMATGPALLTTSFPGSQRGRALGILGTATYVGLTFGPPVGGAILALGGWRWVFFLNVPIAVVVVLLGMLTLPADRERRALPLDLPGTLCLLVGLPPLALALAQGPAWGWTAAPTLLSALAGAVGLALFVGVELKREAPLIDLRLFRSRVLTGATVSALCNYIALFIPIILLPFYLVEGLGLTAGAAGLLLAAEPLAMALTASPSGWLSDRVGTRGLATAGMLILAAGALGLATLGPASSQLLVALWLGVMGLGTGIFISPNSSALMGAAPRHQQGVAGAVMALARTLGMMLGISTGTAVFQAAGGQSGRAWTARDYRALQVAIGVAVGASLFGALAALLRGRPPADKDDHSSVSS